MTKSTWFDHARLQFASHRIVQRCDQSLSSSSCSCCSYRWARRTTMDFSSSLYCRMSAMALGYHSSWVQVLCKSCLDNCVRSKAGVTTACSTLYPILRIHKERIHVVVDISGCVVCARVWMGTGRHVEDYKSSSSLMPKGYRKVSCHHSFFSAAIHCYWRNTRVKVATDMAK